jgi:hypothetical protein
MQLYTLQSGTTVSEGEWKEGRLVRGTIAYAAGDDADAEEWCGELNDQCVRDGDGALNMRNGDVFVGVVRGGQLATGKLTHHR